MIGSPQSTGILQIKKREHTFVVQLLFRQKCYTPQVWPDQGSKPWPPDRDSTFMSQRRPNHSGAGDYISWDRDAQTRQSVNMTPWVGLEACATEPERLCVRRSSSVKNPYSWLRQWSFQGCGNGSVGCLYCCAKVQYQTNQEVVSSNLGNMGRIVRFSFEW